MSYLLSLLLLLLFCAIIFTPTTTATKSEDFAALNQTQLEKWQRAEQDFLQLDFTQPEFQLKTLSLSKWRGLHEFKLQYSDTVGLRHYRDVKNIHGRPRIFLTYDL